MTCAATSAAPPTFESFPLSPATMYALKAIQVTYTTPVQAQILPSALQGKDLLVKAKTSAEKAGASSRVDVSNGTHT